LTSLAVDFGGEEDDDCNPTTRGGQTSSSCLRSACAQIWR
jgi:hypothetical protein